MSGIQPVNGVNIGFSAISTNRNMNGHDYVASRINDLYAKALSRQAASFSGTRSLRRFIDSSSKEGAKLHKIV